MIVRRTWTNDLYAFYCAEEMDRMGVRIVSVFCRPVIATHGEITNFWEVWGQIDTLPPEAFGFDELDRRIDARIENCAG